MRGTSREPRGRATRLKKAHRQWCAIAKGKPKYFQDEGLSACLNPAKSSKVADNWALH